MQFKFDDKPIICTTNYDVPTVNTCELFDAVEADRLKEEGMNRAAEKNETMLWWAQRLAVDLAQTFGQATIDEVHERLRDCGFNPLLLGNAAGSVFSGKKWIFTGEWRKSTRTTNHGRYVRVWRLKS